MGSIYLIRHGQASFDKDDYDDLSILGYEQSRMLGSHIDIHDKADLIVSGAMKRHIQTANTSLGHSFSADEVRVDSGFNEFNHQDIIGCYEARWKDQKKMREYLKEQKNPKKIFQKMFSQAMKRWVKGENNGDYIEAWPTFQARVIEALTRVKNSAGRSKNIFIFTSGGPISVICQWILKIDDEQTLALNGNLANTGVTQLLYDDRRLSILYFNNYGHLEQPGCKKTTFR